MFFICVLKACSLLLQVVLCFDDNDIVHVNGKVDPKWDFDVINLELVFSDLDQEYMLNRARKFASSAC
jgi:ribosome-binding ATPase YchF (GTP1/OBG family)